MEELELELKVIKNNVVVNTLGAKSAIGQLLNALWIKAFYRQGVEIKRRLHSPELCDVIIKYHTEFEEKNGYRYEIRNVPMASGHIDTTKIMILYMN